MKECLLAHWKLKVQQRTEEDGNLAAEPLWRNARFKLEVSQKEEIWLSNKIGLNKLIDVIDPDTRRPKDYSQWRRHVQTCQLEDTWNGHQASHVLREVYGRECTQIRRDTAKRLVRIFENIPDEVVYMLRQTPLQATFKPDSYKIHIDEHSLAAADDERRGRKTRVDKHTHPGSRRKPQRYSRMVPSG